MLVGFLGTFWLKRPASAGVCLFLGLRGLFDFSPDAGLWGVAAAAFLFPTVLPGNSEIVLIGVLAKYPTLFGNASSSPR